MRTHIHRIYGHGSLRATTARPSFMHRDRAVRHVITLDIAIHEIGAHVCRSRLLPLRATQKNDSAGRQQGEEKEEEKEEEETGQGREKTTTKRKRNTEKGTTMRSFDERRSGRSTYRPSSYTEIVKDATEAILTGLADGLTRMEVEFPAVSNVDGELTYS